MMEVSFFNKGLSNSHLYVLSACKDSLLFKTQCLNTQVKRFNNIIINHVPYTQPGTTH